MSPLPSQNLSRGTFWPIFKALIYKIEGNFIVTELYMQKKPPRNCMDEQMVGLGYLAEKCITISVLINNYFCFVFFTD